MILILLCSFKEQDFKETFARRESGAPHGSRVQ